MKSKRKFIFSELFWKRDFFFLQNWCGQSALNEAMESIMRVSFMSFKGFAS